MQFLGHILKLLETVWAFSESIFFTKINYFGWHFVIFDQNEKEIKICSGLPV